MKTKFIAPALMTLFLVLLCSFNNKPKPNTYERHIKLFNSELKLYNDNSYTLHQNGCTYNFRSKGNWRQVGDTIILDHTKVKWLNKSSGNNLELERSSKLLKVHNDTLYFLIDLGDGHERFQYLNLRKN